MTPSARLHIESARQLTQAGRYAEALAACTEVLRREPECADALRIAGVANLFLKQYASAVPMLRRALALQPDDPALICNLGMALECSGAAEQAVQVLRAGATRHPGRRGVLLNLATALQRVYEFDEAELTYETLLRQDSRDAVVLCNLGGVHRDAGRVARAIECFRHALEIDPNLRQAREYLSYALLLGGDLAAGWPAFESRSFHDLSGLAGHVRRWDGQREPGTSLVLVAEQGLGDCIQFVRYGALLNEAGIVPSLQCHPRMVQLLRSTGYFEDVVPYRAHEPAPHLRWFPLLSLPLAFGTTLATVPARVPYLQANPSGVAAWRERLAADRSFKVGIAWQGNPVTHILGLRDRSVPLAQFALLTAVPGVKLFCLQRFDGEDQLPTVAFADRVHVPSPPLDSGEDAFVDTAALIAQLDLVVTCDSSIAHLAGALGVPVWVALKSAPDWRWLLNRDDSPWYPTMTLFRQPAPREWTPVFEEMSRRLSERVAAAHTAARQVTLNT